MAANLSSYLHNCRGALANCIPPVLAKGIGVEVVIQSIMRAANRDAVDNKGALLRADHQTILEAAMDALRAGLIPGSEQAYIIAYGGRATLQLGYKGFIELLQRTGRYADPRTDLVHETELADFAFDRTNLHQPIRHKVNLSVRAGLGDLSADFTGVAGWVYAWCLVPRLDGGPPYPEVIPVREIIRNTPRQTSPAWRDHAYQMLRKAPLRSAARYLVKTSESVAVFQRDAVASEYERQRLQALDVEATSRAHDPLSRAPAHRALPAPSPDTPDAQAELDRRQQGRAPADAPPSHNPDAWRSNVGQQPTGPTLADKLEEFENNSGLAPEERNQLRRQFNVVGDIDRCDPSAVEQLVAVYERGEARKALGLGK